jgi:hypothetical protein
MTPGASRCAGLSAWPGPWAGPGLTSRTQANPAGLAPKTAEDIGATHGDRKPVAAVRGRHYLWRTEQTCRMWASRFVFLLRAALGREVGDFGDFRRAGPAGRKARRARRPARRPETL